MALDTSDPNAVRSAAREILAQPEYHKYDRSIWQTILYYAAHPLELVSLGLSWLSEQFLGSGAAPYVAWTAAIVAVVALVILVVRLQRSTSSSGSVLVHYAPRTSGLAGRDLIAEAEACEAAGNWREAIHLRYSALLISLSDDAIVRTRDGKTTGEYAREVQNNAPGISADFGAATRMFEWVWYGDGVPGETEATEFRNMSTGITKKALA